MKKNDPDPLKLNTGPHEFEMEGWIRCAPFESLLHMEIVEAAEGRAVLRMPFLLQFAQGGGLMHGGAMVSLADTAVVMAIKSILPPRTHFGTTAMETRFFHPVKKGIVTAIARVVDRKDRIIEGEADLFDDEDRKLMTFRSTFKVAKDAVIRSVSFRAD